MMVTNDPAIFQGRGGLAASRVSSSFTKIRQGLIPGLTLASSRSRRTIMTARVTTTILVVKIVELEIVNPRNLKRTRGKVEFVSLSIYLSRHNR